jgi:hypothetical protein
VPKDFIWSFYFKFSEQNFAYMSRVAHAVEQVSLFRSITGFLDFVRRPKFEILENNFSVPGSVSFLRNGCGETHTQSRRLERANLNPTIEVIPF